MKSTELRIGNWYNEFSIPKQATVDLISKLEHIELNGKTAIDVTPIPLTEEWLERFGFTQHHDDASYNGVIYIKHVFNEGGKTWGVYPEEIGSGFVVNKSVKIEYVHQLQNLIHALTGEELTLSE